MLGQISLFEYFKVDAMYDGYEVLRTTNILTNGSRVKIIKGQQFYIITHDKDGYYVALPNEQGGSFGFYVSKSQFKKNFKLVYKKVYPKTKEIWDGKAWIKNPSVA